MSSVVKFILLHYSPLAFISNNTNLTREDGYSTRIERDQSGWFQQTQGLQHQQKTWPVSIIFFYRKPSSPSILVCYPRSTQILKNSSTEYLSLRFTNSIKLPKLKIQSLHQMHHHIKHSRQEIVLQRKEKIDSSIWACRKLIRLECCYSDCWKNKK